MICSITLDFLNFDLLLYALGSGGDKDAAASVSARSVKDQASSLSMAHIIIEYGLIYFLIGLFCSWLDIQKKQRPFTHFLCFV